MFLDFRFKDLDLHKTYCIDAWFFAYWTL